MIIRGKSYDRYDDYEKYDKYEKGDRLVNKRVKRSKRETKEPENIFLAIDIGSVNIKVIIASIKGEKITVIGRGVVLSNGINRGVITNIENASNSINKAIKDAEMMAGVKSKDISKTILSIPSVDVESVTTQGVVNVKDKHITISDINRVLNQARYNADIPDDYTILHVLPYSFKVDSHMYIEDPFNMNARRIEVNATVISINSTTLSNIKRAVTSSGISNIDTLVLDSYASSIATLSGIGYKNGMAVFDLGGQISSMSAFEGRSIIHTSYERCGSEDITKDISYTFHISPEDAEVVKIDYGSLIIDEERDSIILEFPTSSAGNEITAVELSYIQDVIAARVQYIFDKLSQFLEESVVNGRIPSGIIITGGLANLDGMKEFAEAYFDNTFSVRIGTPRRLHGISDDLDKPSFSTVVGLLLYQAGEYTEYEIDSNNELLHKKKPSRHKKTRQKDILDDRLDDNFSDDFSRRRVEDDSFPPSRREIPEIVDDTSVNKNSFFSKIINFFKTFF